MNRTIRIFKLNIPIDIGIILVIAFIKFPIHLYAISQGGYGMFRDEFYYLACANHLDIGYVDHPPFSIYLLAVNRYLFGDSIFALRLLPGLFGAATVFLSGLIARAMGGKLYAQITAALAALCMPIMLGMNSFYSMNSIDIFLWILGAYVTVQLIIKQQPQYWLLLGLVIGVGALNKISMIWFAFGVVVAVAATSERSWLRTVWPYLAGAISFIIFLPFIVWNIQHDYAHLLFVQNALRYRYYSLTLWSFLSGQIILPNYAALPLWILGLVFYFLHPDGKRFKALGIIFLTTASILIINGHSKSEYLSAAYPMIFAGGGIFIEKIIHARRLIWGYTFLIVVVGIVGVPFSLTILPVETFIRYQNAIGINPPRNESHKLAELPQFYADMFGWEDKAKAVAKVFHTLSVEDQANCVAYCDNYGRAGAIDYYRKKYGLPPVICPHNNYWIWGPGNISGDVVIILGGNEEDHKRVFESVQVVDTVHTDFAMPFENDLKIFICRKLKVPIEELWPKLKKYV